MHTQHGQCTGTYHHATLARKFVKAASIGLTLVGRTILFVAAVEDFEVIAIDVVANDDISDEFQNCRLADTSLPNKEDCVWCFNLVL